MTAYVKNEPAQSLPDNFEFHDKLECRFKDQNVFKTLLQCAHSLVETTGVPKDAPPPMMQLRVSKEGLGYFGIDANHVAMLNFEVGLDGFDFFQTDTNAPEEVFTMVLRLDLLQKVAKLCKPREVVCLSYDSLADPTGCKLAFIDPRAEMAGGTGEGEGSGEVDAGEGVDLGSMDDPLAEEDPSEGDGGGKVKVKAEPGLAAAAAPAGAASSAAAAAPAGAAAASAKKKKLPNVATMKEFRLGVSEDGGSASQLEMPKIMEQHTKIQMPVEDFKYMVGTLMELGAPDQKNAMSLISIAKETFYDAKSGKLVEDTKEVVRFGTFCSSGDMHVEFQVGGDLESELAGGQEVLLTKGEDFTEAHPPIRFQNKHLRKVLVALPICQSVSLLISEKYPMIVQLPLDHDAGVIRYVLSPQLDDPNAPVNNAHQNVPEGFDDDAAAEDDFVGGEEDDWSD